MDIVNWIFISVVACFAVVFVLVYMMGLVSGGPGRLIKVFARTVADFAILIAAIYSLIFLGQDDGE